MDIHAARFVQGHLADAGHLLTPSCLSTPHWAHDPRGGVRRAGIGDKAFPVERIGAVLNLLPAVTPADLAHIVPDDRLYVASEMQAFLSFWLEDLPCAVFNRPVRGALSASRWSPRRWRWEAAAAGMPLSRAGAAPSRVVTILGDDRPTDVAPDLGAAIDALVERAKVDTLTIVLAEEAFYAALPRPDLMNESIAKALADKLRQSAG